MAARIDLSDRDFIQDPYPVLNEMREAAPVVHDDSSNLWLVTRYEDVRACLRDRRLGRIYDHVATAEEVGASQRDPRWASFWQVERHSFLELEPPDHTRLRRLISKAFTVRAVEEMRDPARSMAAALVARLAGNDEIDLLAEFAQPYSIGIITRLLGVSDADHGQLLDWSHKMVKMYELNTSDRQAQEAADAAAEFDAFVRSVIDFHRAAPRGASSVSWSMPRSTANG